MRYCGNNFRKKFLKIVGKLRERNVTKISKRF